MGKLGRGHAGADGVLPRSRHNLSLNTSRYFSEPGGNVVVLNGPDGKIVADTFLLPACVTAFSEVLGIDRQPEEDGVITRNRFSKRGRSSAG